LIRLVIQASCDLNEDLGDLVREAHHVVPASPTTAPGRRGYAVDSQRTTATKALADKCEHRLFLSATTHNGYSESFTALLEMIDGRRFSRGANLDERALREVAVRRLKTELPEKDFRKRELKPIVFTPSQDEQRQFALLDRILTDSARAANSTSTTRSSTTPRCWAAASPTRRRAPPSTPSSPHCGTARAPTLW
jgi:hypothetical protein